MKRCIFYLPYKMDEIGTGARMLRPKKMIQAFRDIGYDVFVIEGDALSRKKLIKKIKKQINSGVKYDFMYTESHTEPTLLTSSNHLPTHPFMDFGFFKFVRKKGIKIGLFYCDIYWKFDIYGKGLPLWKKRGAIINYKYDVRQYKKYLNKFYVADKRVCSYLDEDKLTKIAEELPPGAENLKIVDEHRNYSNRDFHKQPLTVFYVGGLGNQYQITELAKAIKYTDKTKLIICCRPREWEKEKNHFDPYMCSRIEIIHNSSDKLETYYREADICSLLFKRDIYIEMAKPFKAYEYLAHEKPVLSTKGTAIGTFTEENNIGWNIEFDAIEISRTLQQIIAEPSKLVEKQKCCASVKKRNLWTTRALQVANGLSQQGIFDGDAEA